jgi:hypothetical protein
VPAESEIAMSIRELRVRGYRSVQDVELRLGQVNVLVGPNGCGKSNLYYWPVPPTAGSRARWPKKVGCRRCSGPALDTKGRFA